MLFLSIIFIYVATTSVYGRPSEIFENDNLHCGYKSCPATDPNKLNVHLIPHSHDDLGWIGTVDQYFYRHVQYIISSVVEALLENPNRRFIQVETAYLHKWWQLQNNVMKNSVKQLINEGRLEIINGGWSMNDEAVTHYQSIIDQFTLGHRWLLENFGTCGISKTGWQIDPFGHSREQASIYSQMGFDSFFFMRFDYRDKAKREKEKTMDLLWKGSDNLGGDSNIFTTALSAGSYGNPNGFCYDMQCGDENIVEDETSFEFNLYEIVQHFTAVVKERATSYPTNNIVITMGDDIQFEGANKNFINIDRLIRGFNKYNQTIDGKEINMIYSTPSCYTKAVNDYVIQKNYTLDYKTDDFIPLISEGGICWTGYYTSRPTSKRYERISNHILQASKQVTALAGFPQNSTFKLASALGIMQHHDAVAGTENQNTEKDYHRMLSAGITDSITQISKALSKLSNANGDIDLHYCPLANVSICEESKKDQFSVLLYNPLGRNVSHYIQLPVDNGTWVVTYAKDNIENSLVSPISDFQFVADKIGGHINKMVLMFEAKNLPPLGYKVYQIKKSNDQAFSDVLNKPKLRDGDTVGYENNYVQLDKNTGFVKLMSINGFEVNITPKLMFYYGSSGNYMFSPNQSYSGPVAITDNVKNQITTSDISIEIKQEMSYWGILTIRIYPDKDYIEIDWLAGPIDIGDSRGKDVIIKYTTDLKTYGIFYTDSNSRELIQRKRNYRPTFTYTDEAPQAANYYPVTSRIVLRDEKAGVEFAVITDRAEGGSSLADGEVELMVHRGLMGSEFESQLYETEYDKGLIARGSHYITFGPVKGERDAKSPSYIQRDIAIKKHLSPLIFFPYGDVPKKSMSFLRKDLPDNVHLLTLEKWNDTDNTYLIRLEHFLEKNDDNNFSKPVTVDLKNLFSIFKVVSLDERTLNGVTPLKDVKKLKWSQLKDIDSNILSRNNRLMRDATNLKITLAPMQIRTFIAKVKAVNK